MDKKTLLEHEKLWGREERPSPREFKRLTTYEQEVYEILKNDVLAKSLRLEQERISFSLVRTTVKKNEFGFLTLKKRLGLIFP